jgi:hypothetical protein
MVAAESAGEFAVNGSLAATLASMPWSAASTPGSRYAEILLRIRAMAGKAADVRVVATREVTPRVLDAGQHRVPR